ncbi:MAG: saccharopine dehydrogenase NADP-binding domain-containing protein [Acidobacteria bacterium]|nr:saccharopine dehydrogenase NADP-binding domain-containing protein [Acidobacteriota bacterium]
MSHWMIYGANGYTGQLVAREAVRRGHKPILAARSAQSIESIARELSLPSRAFSLGDNDALAGNLEGVSAIVHCAGPFVHTSAPMVDACVRSKTHYLDITGEIAVFEAVIRRGDDAKQAGIALVPGVGFDVVPSDCLAALLAEKMPDATDLELAFHSKGGGLSRGTLLTMIEGIHEGGAIRAEGRIVRVPVAWQAKEIPFDCGAHHAVTIPWGDVSTAWHTTRIPNIRVFAGSSPRATARLRRLRPLLPILGFTPLRRLLQLAAGRRQGPDADVRARASMHLWGQVSKPGAEPIAMTMRTAEGYRFTAESAVSSVERVIAGTVPPGAWTPSRAFGAGFAESVGATFT